MNKATMPRREPAIYCGHLHALGPRAVFELLRELAAGADLHKRLERYGRLDAGIVKRLGADEMPPARSWSSMGAGRERPHRRH
jgi:hypothetical protein